MSAHTPDLLKELAMAVDVGLELSRRLEAAKKERESLRSVNAELLAELQNIANANPKTWDAEVRDQFMPWAQNRARAAIARATAQAGSALLENKS